MDFFPNNKRSKRKRKKNKICQDDEIFFWINFYKKFLSNEEKKKGRF